jgi:hypothetical protein
MKKKSPYPHRGTEAGDKITGPCEAIGCGKILRRGDQFITLMGDRLICEGCRRSGFKVKEQCEPSAGLRPTGPRSVGTVLAELRLENSSG